MTTEIGAISTIAPPTDPTSFGAEKAQTGAQNVSLTRQPDETAREEAKRIASAPEAKMKALLDKLVEGELRPYARLRIEKNDDAGAFVYTTVDSRSGEVIRQWPREEVLEMMTDAREGEGMVVDTRV